MFAGVTLSASASCTRVIPLTRSCLSTLAAMAEEATRQYRSAFRVCIVSRASALSGSAISCSLFLSIINFNYLTRRSREAEVLFFCDILPCARVPASAPLPLCVIFDGVKQSTQCCRRPRPSYLTRRSRGAEGKISFCTGRR